jgi:lysine/ornithine N-monooxygenase
MNGDTPFDVLGIGFGPSNLALAIALQEQSAHFRFGFIEKQPSFAWHENMLIDDSRMQISFLKDLVTLRDPTSPFTFIRYLHQHQRLEDFINLRTFYPVRTEYNRYMQWVASHFEHCCAYGETVVSVEPVSRGSAVSSLRVISKTSGGEQRIRLARNLVVAVGGTPRIPEACSEVRDDPRVFHSSVYLRRIPSAGKRKVAVIGSGQSAAEIFLDLQRFPDAHVDFISRGAALKPADSSPLINEIFHPQFTDVMFRQKPETRSALIQEFRSTNYGVIDIDLIERINELLYLQKVSGEVRNQYLRSCQVRDASSRPDGICLSLHHLLTDKTEVRCYDTVILATGYERESHHVLLTQLRQHLVDFTVDRDYRVRQRPGFLPQIYLQGSCEPTHGLSDTLLSVLAIRSKEIVDSLLSAQLNNACAHPAP